MIAQSDNQQEQEPRSGPKRPRLAFAGAKRIYTYVPLPDITAAELSEVTEMLQVAMGVAIKIIPPQIADILYDDMAEGVQRHFLVKEHGRIVLSSGSG